jgi:putative selenium metabolism hydrolase
MESVYPIDRDALVRFAQDLVRIPSPSTHEGRVAARLAEEMRAVGFDEVFVSRIGSVVGKIGTGRPVLLYNGHMDTVEVTDPKAWPHDPFGAVIEDDAIHGMGAVDMKGALASMVYGVKALRASGVEPKGTLYVVGVVQEEPSEGHAMRVLIEEEGIRPDLVVLGEATDLQVARGQRGRLGINVTTHGKSCHGSAPDKGVNAINAAARLIFETELLASRLGNDSFLGKGTLAVTRIESQSSSLNAIPDRCTFYVDRRLTLGETEARAIAELQGIIAREQVNADVWLNEVVTESYTGQPVRLKESYPAWVTAEEHPLVRALVQTIRQALGFKPKVDKWDFSTDGVYTMGVAGIPTVGFGPGPEGLAHTVRDQVPIAHLVSAAQVYAQLAVHLLGAR